MNATGADAIDILHMRSCPVAHTQSVAECSRHEVKLRPVLPDIASICVCCAEADGAVGGERGCSPIANSTLAPSWCAVCAVRATTDNALNVEAIGHHRRGGSISLRPTAVVAAPRVVVTRGE